MRRIDQGCANIKHRAFLPTISQNEQLSHPGEGHIALWVASGGPWMHLQLSLRGMSKYTAPTTKVARRFLLITNPEPPESEITPPGQPNHRWRQAGEGLLLGSLSGLLAA